ncbi:TetR/AcrR family transcriptional regulator [Azotosporobacter soli]|uniref:TetR/AcrR family transcriptional regulator n=1 Tax=Azotosporobacter soli TaxID=3055040 RepID=UPI0031FEC533
MGRSREFEESIVLEKAMELFWRQGYEKTSLSDLVAHMGIHRRSLYDTFGDKHSLFLKAIDFFGAQIKEKLTADVSRCATAEEAIRCIFEYMIEGRADRPWGCLFVNAATEMAPHDEAVAEKTQAAFHQLEQLLAALIRRGQQAAEFTATYDAQVLAEHLHTTLLGIRVMVRNAADKEKLRRIAECSLAILHD